MRRIPAILLAGIVASCSDSKTSAGGEDDLCAPLWKEFTAAVGSDGHAKDWFMARCRGGAEGVAACLRECDEFAGPLLGNCLMMRASGCMQKHRTGRAIAEGVAETLATGLRSGELRRDRHGLVRLPGELAHLSLDGGMWTSGGDEPLRLFLATWRGRCGNVAGFLYSARSFSGDDVRAYGDDPETIRIPGLAIHDPCALENPVVTAEHSEPFSVVERVDSHWMLVHRGWD